MVRVSVLADCLKTISNAEKRGKRQVLIRPSSKVVIKFLQKMQEHGKPSNVFCHYIWGLTLSRERRVFTCAAMTRVNFFSPKIDFERHTLKFDRDTC